MRKVLIAGAFFLWGFGAHMAYAWFDCDYISPEHRYEMDKALYDRQHEGDWNRPYMNFHEWEQQQADREYRMGLEIHDAFDWFDSGRPELNGDSEGRGCSRENATWGQD